MDDQIKSNSIITLLNNKKINTFKAVRPTNIVSYNPIKMLMKFTKSTTAHPL